MSYEWIRRRQRYLGFRYLFPEIVAPWIQFKRALLRVLWFFTHPVDEFFETIGEILAWPFVTLATLFAWISTGIRTFFRDMISGVEVLFRYLGHLPVWTGAAIAGSLGVILTTLLFFLSLMQFRPVTASISSTPEDESPPAVLPVISRPEPAPEVPFDPFAETGVLVPARPVWQPEPAASSPAQLSVHIERLSLPPGWDARRRIAVVSTSAPPTGLPFDRFRHQSLLADGWTVTHVNRAIAAQPFLPYVSRRGSQSSHIAPRWVTVAESIGPFQRVDPRRHPAVTISRTTPRTAPAGGSLRYELIVANQGTEPLDSVTVHEVVSALDRVLEVDPPASVIGHSLVWNLTHLDPGAERRITIELKPDQLLPITGGSTVQVTTGISAVTRISAPRPEPSIIAPEPEELFVVTPPPQTEPATVPQEPAPPEIGMILPSFDDEETAEPEPAEPELFLSFEPEPIETPQPPAMLLPENDDFEPAHFFEEPEFSTGNAPIHFEMRTPKLVSRDTPVPAVFEVRNPGAAELTDLVIQVHMTDELNHENGRTLRHRIERLPAGDVYRTRLTTKAVGDGIARLHSTLTSSDDLQSEAVATVQVSGDAVTPVAGWQETAPRRRFTCGP